MGNTQSIKSALSKNALLHLSTRMNRTDMQISEFYGVDRTYISHIRADYGIPNKMTLGRRGELEAMKVLEEKGFRVSDMNLIDSQASYDILLNGSIRLDVKSASFKEEKNSFTFALSEKRENGCKPGENRIRLKSGRTKKIFSKTCDFLVFVGFKDNIPSFYIVPSDELDETKGTLYFKIDNPHFRKYKNNWQQFNHVKSTKK